MAWVAIANAGELAEGQMKPVVVEGRRLLLCQSQGESFVVDERCSHEDYSLYLGCVREGRIKCSLHGSWFDLRTGQALEQPAHHPLGTYPVKVAEGKLWVEA